MTAKLLSVLYDDLTATIIAAFRTYPVIHYGCTAVRAGSKGRDGSEVVSTAFVPALL